MRLATRPDNLFERLAMVAGQVPAPLFDTYVAMFTARAVMAGASLGIFAALAERPDDAPGLAGRLDLDPPGVEVLVTALHALGYVEPFVSHHLSLDEVNRGFELMEAQDGIRSVIHYD